MSLIILFSSRFLFLESCSRISINLYVQLQPARSSSDLRIRVSSYIETDISSVFLEFLFVLSIFCYHRRSSSFFPFPSSFTYLFRQDSVSSWMRSTLRHAAVITPRAEALIASLRHRGECLTNQLDVPLVLDDSAWLRTRYWSRYAHVTCTYVAVPCVESLIDANPPRRFCIQAGYIRGGYSSEIPIWFTRSGSKI